MRFGHALELLQSAGSFGAGSARPFARRQLSAELARCRRDQLDWTRAREAANEERPNLALSLSLALRVNYNRKLQSVAGNLFDQNKRAHLFEWPV